MISGRFNFKRQQPYISNLSHSDHRPLLVYFDSAEMLGPKSFKYEVIWNSHLAIGFIVYDA